jgi:hypothetical protein
MASSAFASFSRRWRLAGALPSICISAQNIEDETGRGKQRPAKN